MTDVQLSDDALDAEIVRLHASAESHYATAWEDAVACGHFLHERKGRLRHGAWLPWLREHFPASVRTAQGYMRLAEHEEDARAVAHLGVAGALKQLAAPKEDPQRAPEDDTAVTDAEREALKLREQHAWLYGSFEEAVRHIVLIEGRRGKVDALVDYAQAHRLPSDEEKVRCEALCTIVGDVLPMFDKGYAGVPANVWFAIIDRGELIFHPGWTGWCVDRGQGVARRLLEVVPDLNVERHPAPTETELGNLETDVRLGIDKLQRSTGEEFANGAHLLKGYETWTAYVYGEIVPSIRADTRSAGFKDDPSIMQVLTNAALSADPSLDRLTHSFAKHMADTR